MDKSKNRISFYKIKIISYFSNNLLFIILINRILIQIKKINSFNYNIFFHTFKKNRNYFYKYKLLKIMIKIYI